jgi:hypothetical protein
MPAKAASRLILAPAVGSLDSRLRGMTEKRIQLLGLEWNVVHSSSPSTLSANISLISSLRSVTPTISA